MFGSVGCRPMCGWVGVWKCVEVWGGGCGGGGFGVGRSVWEVCVCVCVCVCVGVCVCGAGGGREYVCASSLVKHTTVGAFIFNFTEHPSAHYNNNLTLLLIFSFFFAN